MVAPEVQVQIAPYFNTKVLRSIKHCSYEHIFKRVTIRSADCLHEPAYKNSHREAAINDTQRWLGILLVVYR